MTVYRSKSISLAEDVWSGFDQLRAVHGSYNKALRFVLSAGGVFEPKVEIETRNVPIGNGEDVKIAVVVPVKRSSADPERDHKPLLKPKDARK